KKSREKCPKRGKRYSRAQKGEILQYVKETSVADAASKFDITAMSSVLTTKVESRIRGSRSGFCP
ncbi:MAG: hypothetical protein R6V54_10065, partial [Desulfobacteraceae bacterium]